LISGVYIKNQSMMFRRASFLREADHIFSKIAEGENLLLFLLYGEEKICFIEKGKSCEIQIWIWNVYP